MANQSSSFKRGDGISLVREVDGLPSLEGVQVLEVSNGTLSSPSPGVARVGTGGGGGSDSEYFEKVDFTYQTASPLDLLALPGGNVVDAVTVVVTTPFNDPAATCMVGTVGTPGLIAGAGEVDLELAQQYGFDNKVLLAAAETLRLTLSPAGATAGAGYVLLRVRK